METLPNTMRAFVLHGHGEFDVLRFHSEWPVPNIGDDEVLLKISACGINNTDINTRTGWYSKSVSSATTGGAYEGDQSEDGGWDGGIDFPRIQGGDPVGVVVAVGNNVDRSLIGKRCLVDPVLRDWNDTGNFDKCTYLGSAKDGGFAEYMAIDHRNVHPVNCGWSDAELATIAISYSTAENLLNRANISQNDTVLIPGASGGVGSALIQLANRRGVFTIAMASVNKHDQIRKLNPDAILERQPENLKSTLNEITDKQTVDAVIDVVGGKQFPILLDVIKRGGIYACSGAIAGPIVELDLRTMYLNDLTFHGCTIIEPKVFPNLVGYIERDEIQPMLAASYRLEDLHDAQRAFITKKQAGNIVMVMN